MVGLLLPLTGWFPDPVLPFVAPITLILLGLLPGIDDRAALSFESGGPTRVRIRLALAALSGDLWLADRQFDAGRGDFFYLADAFLHGRTWLTAPLLNDVIPIDGRYYVLFAPFPAIVLMPLVAILGPLTADQINPINAFLAAWCVAMCWWLLGRVGVKRTLIGSG